jgi:MFS family permease
VLVAFAALGLWWGAWGALVPDIQVNAGVTDAELGIAVAFVGVGALVSMRRTGTLVDRHGDVVLPLIIVAFAVAGIAPGLVSGTVGLAVAMAAVGATSGSLDVAINTAAVAVETHTDQPLMNLAHGMFSLTVIGASALTGLLRAADVSPVTVLVLVAVTLLGCAVVVVVDRSPELTSPVEPSTETAMPPWWHPPRRLLVIGVLIALAFFVESVWQNWSAVHLESDLDASPFVGSLGPALFGASAAAGRLWGHRLEGRHERRALVRVGAGIAAVGTVLAALAPSVPLVLAGVVAAGAGTAICAPILFGFSGAGVDAERRGAAVSTVTTLGYLGFVLAPAVVGLLAGARDLPTALALTSVAAVALAVWAPSARAATREEPM